MVLFRFVCFISLDICPGFADLVTLGAIPRGFYFHGVLVDKHVKDFTMNADELKCHEIWMS